MTQGIFWLFYYIHYVISPKTAHAIVTYLEVCILFIYYQSEAVKTYTHAIHDYDSGNIPEWKNIKIS